LALEAYYVYLLRAIDSPAKAACKFASVLDPFSSIVYLLKNFLLEIIKIHY